MMHKVPTNQIRLKLKNNTIQQAVIANRITENNHIVFIHKGSTVYLCDKHRKQNFYFESGSFHVTAFLV